MIAIIDYDAGNLKSVENALTYLGNDVVFSREEREILNADKVILPGVGSFGDAMGKIREFGLDQTIYKVIEKGIPFLGICLGLQLLFESSTESPSIKGLGILKGEILKIPEKEGLKIPHVGWNSLEFPREGKLFKGITCGSYVYFVHSYYLKSKKEEIVTATTNYSTKIHVSIEKDNIFGCQFHPEKSNEIGLKMLQNFSNL